MSVEGEGNTPGSDPAGVAAAAARAPGAEPSLRTLLERPRTTPSIRPVASAAGLRAAIAAARRGASGGGVSGSSPGSIPAGASVERVTVEVRIGARTEMVGIGLDGGRLLCAATDGAGEASPFAQAALAWLDSAVDGPLDSESARAPTTLAVGALDATRSASDDLLLAVARGGVRAGATPAALEALGRIAAEPRGAVPLVRSRWLGRIQGALEAGDGDLVARLLSTGAPVAMPQPSDTAVDRTYVELAREPVLGEPGTTLERRHLLDLGRGEIVLEERGLGEAGASLGPCPRVCTVGYGELYEGTPRRLVVSQYAVLAEVGDGDWERVLGAALPLAAARENALGALCARGDAEPVALVLGAVAVDGDGVVDDAGTRYPLADGELVPGGVAAFVSLARRLPVRWALGRFEIARGRAGFVPLACGWREGERWRHARLR